MVLFISRRIGFLIVSCSLLLIACTNQDRSHDCKEYAQAIQRIGQRAASNLQVFSWQSKQGQIQFLNSMAEGEKRSAQAFQSMKLKDPKAKQIQSEIVRILEELSQNWRDQMKVVESLPEGSDKATRAAALRTFKTTQTILFQRLKSQVSAMNAYCRMKN